MSSRRAEVAHVLRRLTFGPFPGQVDDVLARHGDAAAVVEAMLVAPPLPFDPSADDPSLPAGGAIDIDHPPPDDDLRYYAAFRTWWPRRMRRDDAGLHDRMMWFWHTHLTTSFVKVDNTTLCWDQMRTLHRHALGNFGDLIKAISIDRAMLRYLDGAGSNPGHPNENYARELMELYTLGVDQYTQDDVVAAARVFAGWQVSDRNELQYSEQARLTEPVTFLGVTDTFDIPALVDVLLQQEACAPFVVGKLWRYLIGGPRDEQLIGRWAATFRDSGYEIAPLVAEMVRSDAFAGAHRSRARTPVEWHAAAMRAGDVADANAGGLAELGQIPYGPPTPAGWPGDDAWLSPSHVRAKAMLLAEVPLRAAAELSGEGSGLVDAVLERCSIESLPDDQRAALDQLADDLRRDASTSDLARARAVLTAALLTPEFSLA